MRILVVEEERMLAHTMKGILTEKGFAVKVYPGGSSGLQCALAGTYDLLILSVTAPGTSGVQTVQTVRKKHPMVPVILLGSRSGAEDRIIALRAGADYYLPKPIDFRELVACVDALLRRSSEHMDGLIYGKTKLDLETCLLLCGEKSIRLSAKELNIMCLLLGSRDKVIGKRKILERVWGCDSGSVDNNVEVYISLLRKKLGRIGSDLRIITLRGLGYYLEIQNK